MSRKALVLLTLVNLLNYLDRYIISAIAPKLQDELHFDNTQIGFLMSAFMIGYMITSPIFGYLGDKKSRPMLMATGVMLWSIATFFSGLCRSFGTLITTRIAVGVGEASYATISPAFLREQYHDDRSTNKALSIFYAAIPVGAALGYIWGGLIADHFSWNLALFTAALPGIILAVLVYRLPDADRKVDTAVREAPASSYFSEALKLLKIKAYREMVFGYIAYTFAIGGFASWAPNYGVRVLGASVGDIGTQVGLVTLFGGILGTAIGGRWGGILIKDGDSIRGFSRFSAWSSLAAFPFALAACFATTIPMFIGLLFVAETMMFISTSPVNTVILVSVPKSMAATAMALSILLIHILGDMISPTLIGYLADHIDLSKAMMILPAAIFVSAAIWWHLSMSPTAALPAELDHR